MKINNIIYKNGPNIAKFMSIPTLIAGGLETIVAIKKSTGIENPKFDLAVAMCFYVIGASFWITGKVCKKQLKKYGKNYDALSYKSNEIFKYTQKY